MIVYPANLPIVALLASVDADLIELIIGVVGFVVLISLGLIFGRATEKRHLASIAERKARYADMLVTDLRSFVGADASRGGGELFVGEVVVGSDYLKTWLAGLRNLFGGEVRSFETLVRRARDEAQLRVMEQARAAGYNAVCNMRWEFTGLGGSATEARGRGAPMAGMIAWGTAYHAAATTPNDPMTS